MEDIGRRHIAECLVITAIVVVVDKVSDCPFKLAWEFIRNLVHLPLDALVVALQLVATLTPCMESLVSWVLASAASALSSIFWGTLASTYIEVSLLSHTEITPSPQLYGFRNPFCVPSSLTVYTVDNLYQMKYDGLTIY